MKLLQNCRWQQILQHYRVYGNLEGRKLDCEGVTLDHEYMSDPRYPHVLLSSSTANMLSRQPGNLAQMRPSESLPQQPRAPSSIISGSVCGGLTNQRLALIDLLVIGYLLKATVVLPELNLNGRQTGQRYQESRSQLAPFTTFFDFDKTQANLADLVHVVLGDNRTGNASEGFSPLGYLDPRISPDISVHGSLRNPRWYAKALKRERSSQSGASGSTDQHGFALTHLRFDCTLMSVQKDTPEMQNLFWRLDAALVPSEKIARVANKTIRKLRSLSNASGGSGLYTSLHLRVENDWVEHCARWESVHSYPRRDNCMTNTDRLGSVFAIEGVDEKQPVYVATEETGKQLSHVRGMDGLSRYRAASKSTLYAPGDPDAQWLINRRELSAFHDLIVCAQSNRLCACAFDSGHREVVGILRETPEYPTSRFAVDPRCAMQGTPPSSPDKLRSSKRAKPTKPQRTTPMRDRAEKAGVSDKMRATPPGVRELIAAGPDSSSPVRQAKLQLHAVQKVNRQVVARAEREQPRNSDQKREVQIADAERKRTQRGKRKLTLPLSP